MNIHLINLPPKIIMFFDIIFTVFICALTQLIINDPKKLLAFLTYISEISLILKYVPKFNQILRQFSCSNTGMCPLGLPMVDTKDWCNMLPKPKTSKYDTLKSVYELQNKKVIIIHHGEVSSSIPFIGSSSTRASLTLSDANKIIDTMRNIDENTEITLIINTLGGNLSAAEVIINALLKHKGKIITYIPYQCASAGTIIALASDAIIMDKNAYCGPIDPQLSYLSANTIINYCEDYAKTASNSLIVDISNLLLKKAKTAVKRVEDLLINMHKVKPHFNLTSVKDTLLHNVYNHDKPLFAKDLFSSVDNINTGIPPDVMEIYTAFLEK